MNFYKPCFSDCSHCECHIETTHLSLLSGVFFFSCRLTDSKCIH